MPDNYDGIWRTYTNVIYANDRVLVPTFAHAEPGKEAQALALYRRLLPGRRIVPIDASSIIENLGALRCVSLNVPWLGEAPGARRLWDGGVAGETTILSGS